MRKTFLILSLLPLSAAGGMVFVFIGMQERDAVLQAELAKSFNVNDLTLHPEAPRVLPSDMPLRDSPAPIAPSSMMPIRDALGARPMIPAFGITQRISLPPEPPTPATERSADETRTGPLSALLERPGQYLVSKTLLGKPANFQGFLKSKARTESYVNHPAVKTVLDDPAKVKMILSQPAVVSAFLASPSMQDPKTAKALAQSPLLAKILASPGVAATLRNPAEIQKIITRPDMVQWLSKNPEAANGISKLLPGFPGAARAAQFNTRPKLKPRQ